MNDTLIVTEKDDLHSEDHGKIKYFRTKYLIGKNILTAVTNGELVKGKWIDKKIKSGEYITYQKSK